ncbi:SusD/RagB family nutrient-binding outer membrane lipoprotein [uncultured Parabacteroides sp.]|jgi:hypothetical protein|uniref:SusD/RagB family nutrient-binding outer membrane lipoprotein n=1 Tax=uncultured Parabacteroides sp. TaxID=512312 RepID=UPI0025EA3F30|nr:SusD/RagB family nutrient-binding outer membrane lipoprotein [uncultured Parabacteroides sp.]
MKKYKSIVKLLAISFLTAFSITSCTEDAMDKVNENPNNPQDVPAKFLITDLGVNTGFSIVGGDFSLYSSVYIEHEVGISNQLYRAETRIGEPTIATTYNNTWGSVYSDIKNAKIAIKKCQEDPSEIGNVVTEAIARIYLAYNGAIVTDLFGDTPFSETGILNENGTPAFMQPKIETQESIYAEINKNLDEAIALLDGGNAVDAGPSGAVGSKDYIYSGKASSWYKAAYALKARYTMRLLNRSNDKTKDLNDILTYVSKSFQSANEECKLSIYNGDSQVNPLWGFSYSRNSLAASKSLIDKFAERNDPRSPQAFLEPDPTGYIVYGEGGVQATNIEDIVAAPNGTPDEVQNTYGMSMPSWAITTPTLLISYHEVKFLEAEALCRLGRTKEAEVALKEAISAAIVNLGNAIADAADNWVGGENNLNKEVAEAYFDKSVKPLFDANPLKETMIQKYLAFFGGSGESVEAYNDYRRLKGAGENFIELKNPLNSNKFPYRFGYGADDVLANPAVKTAFGDGQYVYTEPVWWAGGSR